MANAREGHVDRCFTGVLIFNKWWRDRVFCACATTQKSFTKIHSTYKMRLNRLNFSWSLWRRRNASGSWSAWGFWRCRDTGHSWTGSHLCAALGTINLIDSDICAALGAFRRFKIDSRRSKTHFISSYVLSATVFWVWHPPLQAQWPRFPSQLNLPKFLLFPR